MFANHYDAKKVKLFPARTERRDVTKYFPDCLAGGLLVVSAGKININGSRTILDTHSGPGQAQWRLIQ